MTLKAKQKSRQCEERKSVERSMTLKPMQKSREKPERTLIERSMSLKSKTEIQTIQRKEICRTVNDTKFPAKIK